MRIVDPKDPNKFDDFTDDEWEEWSANFIKHATEKAEKFGLTEADLAPILKAQQVWREDRARKAQDKAEADKKRQAEEAQQAIRDLNAKRNPPPDSNFPH